MTHCDIIMIYYPVIKTTKFIEMRMIHYHLSEHVNRQSVAVCLTQLIEHGFVIVSKPF